MPLADGEAEGRREGCCLQGSGGSTGALTSSGKWGEEPPPLTAGTALPPSISSHVSGHAGVRMTRGYPLAEKDTASPVSQPDARAPALWSWEVSAVEGRAMEGDGDTCPGWKRLSLGRESRKHGGVFPAASPPISRSCIADLVRTQLLTGPSAEASRGDPSATSVPSAQQKQRRLCPSPPRETSRTPKKGTEGLPRREGLLPRSQGGWCLCRQQSWSPALLEFSLPDASLLPPEWREAGLDISP